MSDPIGRADIIYGEPWIKTEGSSIFWFSRNVTVGLLCASFANCCILARPIQTFEIRR
jgi:hypothetical protein